MADDSTVMTLEIFGRYKDCFSNPQAERQMGSVLKLVAHITAKIRDMPTHAKWLHRTQDAARIELPGVIGVVQITMRGKIVTRNHFIRDSSLAQIERLKSAPLYDVVGEESKGIVLSKTVQQWTPYIEDARNYYISDMLAKQAQLKFVTLNHPYTNVPVSDEKIVGMYNIQKVTLSPADIQFTKKLTTAINLVTMLEEKANH